MSKENEVTQESNLDSGEFFDQLENDVNGGIIDDEATYDAPTEVTQPNPGPQEVTQGSNDANQVDWEKRYKDSSREAQKMNTELSNLKPFVPVLEAMKNDAGLVNHVRDYLEGGGSTKSVQEKLGLGEDFNYDHNEAMTNPDSDSGKVFQSHIDSTVNQRVGQMMNVEKQKNMQAQQQSNMQREIKDFKSRHKMSDDDFADLQSAAQTRKLTLDDVFYLVNKDKNNQNVASNTRKDMLNQMKNVRNIPTTASGANSQGTDKAPQDDIFDALLDTDSDLDKMFG